MTAPPLVRVRFVRQIHSKYYPKSLWKDYQDYFNKVEERSEENKVSDT